MNGKERKHDQETLQRISKLRLIDDVFMRVCFKDYIEGAELLLKIILDRDDLKVTEVKTQERLTNLHGHDVCLDIYATDKNGDRYNVEIQRADTGAHQKRARYHSSMVDAYMLNNGEKYTDLCENYVIFITENDVLGLGRPIYHIDRFIGEDKVQFNDGEHIIYVNGSMKSNDSALGKLMSDFFCTEAKDMYYKELADRVKLYKETEGGLNEMRSVSEEWINEGEFKKACEIAVNLINDGSLSLDKIAEYSGLPIEKIMELADKKSA